jgi:two-component system sensor histidine kinase MprB
MSLRARLTVVIAVLVALATLAVAIAAFQTTRRQVYLELDRSLAQVAGVADGDGIRGMGRMRGLAALDVGDGTVAQVVRADGQVQVLAGEEPAVVPSRVLDQARDGRTLSFPTRVGGDAYRAVARPLGEDAVLVVAADVADQVRVLRVLLARITLIGVTVAGLAAAAGWLAAGALVAPLRRLTAAAEHVSATGDLDVPVRTDAADEAGRLSRAFDEMLAALRASQAQQQQLVDDAGHELRTPIASIRSNAEVLRRHPDLDAGTRARIADDLIGESAELTTLVNSLVDLAGVSATAEDPQPVEMAELVRGAVRRLPPEQRARVVVSGAASAVLPPSQVQRALVNLLTNAVKFDPSGAPVEVTVTRQDGWVDVGVRDHGPGIATGDLPHVFARFYRADSARSTPGSGLGLAIVADVAQRTGGTVTAATHQDGGAVLHLRLPAAPPQA